VQAGQDLLWIVRLDRAQVVAEVPETSASRVKVGQSTDVTLDAEPSDTLQGTVTAIGRETLASTSPLLAEDPFAKEVQWVPVWIRLQGSGWHPKAGESAVVRIDAPAKEGS
jgi:multidrug resistance efflux pump